MISTLLALVVALTWLSLFAAIPALLIVLLLKLIILRQFVSGKAWNGYGTKEALREARTPGMKASDRALRWAMVILLRFSMTALTAGALLFLATYWRRIIA